MARGSGGLQRLREELEAENEGIWVPTAARWLCGTVTRTPFNEGRLTRPSVVLTVVEEAAAGCLCQRGACLVGVRHEVEPFEKGRQDAFCSRCCAWGHIAPQCPAADSRCALCREVHQTSGHRCPVEG